MEHDYIQGQIIKLTKDSPHYPNKAKVIDTHIDMGYVDAEVNGREVEIPFRHIKRTDWLMVVFWSLVAVILMGLVLWVL